MTADAAENPEEEVHRGFWADEIVKILYAMVPLNEAPPTPATESDVVKPLADMLPLVVVSPNIDITNVFP